MAEDGQPHGMIGVSMGGVRDHNERLLLSTINQLGAVPGSDLARATGLSAQTVSVILRKLEADGLLARGKPQRGRVGKPSIPMELAAGGAYSVGLKIGRRSADLALLDFHGEIRALRQIHYEYPLPTVVFPFLRDGLDAFVADLPRGHAERVCGIGIAAPFQIWRWHDVLKAPPEEFDVWRDTDFHEEVARFSALDVQSVNDATAACLAEHALGNGSGRPDYGYIFVGSFVGGGIVLDGRVYQGPHRNAGAWGPLRLAGSDGTERQLLDSASLFVLEDAIREAGGDPSTLWTGPRDWRAHEEQLGPWIALAGDQIARAALSACAIIDFPALVVDGAFPPEVRARLVARIEDVLPRLDSRGLVLPEVIEGRAGENARVIGAAYAPIAARYFNDGATLGAARKAL